MISSRKQNETSASGFALPTGVGICLRNHTDADLRVVRKQLGMNDSRLTGEPDIVLRFEEQLEPPSLHFADDATAFSADKFFVRQRKEQVFLQIPVQDVGAHCELVCRRGVAAVPMLDSIVKLTALSKGILPLHASSFVFREQGAFVSGLAHSAKTTTLMGFMAHGAQCIGDDTAYLDRNGRLMGDMTAISVSDRHLADLPELRSAVSYRQRLAINTAVALTRSISLAPGYGNGQSSLSRGLRKLGRILTTRRSVDVPRDRLFSSDSLCDSHSLHHAILSLAHDCPQVVVEEISRDEFVDRLVYVIVREFDDLTTLYQKFRFAFPSRRNLLLEQLADKIRDVAMERLTEPTFHAVHHPYPVSPRSMFDALRPLF